MSNNLDDTQLSPTKRALLALKDMQAKLAASERAKTEPIAIVGLGCRFQGGSNDPEAFWQLLRNGVDAITEVPKERWDIDAYYDPDPQAAGKMYVRNGGFIDQVDQFDPQFFGITPREAVSMDPQQRLLLEVSWEALEHAGFAADKLIGSQTGVFVGIMNLDYFQLATDPSLVDAHTATGNAFSVTSGRLSYNLGLQGPSVAIDTACSSSLVAVHMACQSLRTRECNLALAAGVNLMLTPVGTINDCRARMLATDGRCKTFDAAADGFARGEGCGVVVLKRLSDAIADQDHILALIRGSAVNQDGRSGGLTVPNGPSQQAVIRSALANAGVEPRQVSYVEAHGTGTSLGDPIELRALAAVLGKGRSPDQNLIVGSVKTNVGHLESAAGVAGLIKLVLAMQHQEIPPHLHLNNPNPYIPWTELPIRIPTEIAPWSAANGPRIAGLSSFGFSGTNAHLVVEEAPAPQPQAVEVERPFHLLSLSARSEAALQQLASRFAAALKATPDLKLADACFTANTGRSLFAHRLAVVAESSEQACEQLAAFSAGSNLAGVFNAHLQDTCRPKVAFLFTGQGSQYPGMARELYNTQPTFRQVLDRCDEILRPYLQQPLLSVLYPDPVAADSYLDQTAYTQPALFAVEYALSELWKSWGVTPTAVLGHSVGEYVAACVAGVFSLEDGLKLIAERSRLMQALPLGGEMAAVFAPEARVVEAVAPYAQQVAIAAINSPQNTVISGAGEAMQAVLKELAAIGIETRRLNVSHAFHSPLMEPMLAEFEQRASEITYAKPHLDLISNVTGQLVQGAEVSQASYWRRHVREAVRFAASMQTLHSQGYELFVEIGSSPILLNMGRQCLPEGVGVWLPSLRRGQNDWQQILQSLRSLYLQGVAVDWSGFDQDYQRSRVPLPSYPWQRERYWLELKPQQKDIALHHGTTQLAATAGLGNALSPLLSQRLRSALKEQLFESQLSSDLQPFLGGHQVYGMVVLPGAAYLEMALAAAAAIYGEVAALQEVQIQEALILPTNSPQTVQLILTPTSAGQATFQILSLKAADGADTATSWVEHAVGKVQVGVEPAPTSVVLKDLQASFTEELSVETYYQQLQERGLEYGDSFQAIQQLWRREGAALGRIHLPVSAGSTDDYQLHPVLLDAGFQMLFATLASDGAGDTYLPVGVDSLQVYRRPDSNLWIHGQMQRHPGDNHTYTGELCLYNDAGEVVAVVAGLHVKRVSRQLLQQLAPQLPNWLYELNWQPQPRRELPVAATAGRWLLFADLGGTAALLAQLLERQGETCVLVYPGTATQQLTPEHWTLNAATADYQQLLAADAAPWRGVVHLWGLDHAVTNDLEAAQTWGCRSVLQLVQQLARHQQATPPRLWLVTQGTQAVAGSPVTAVAPSTLWGLGRVIALEHPHLWGGMIDLAVGGSEAAAAICAELWRPDGEDQLAFRSGRRYVARLGERRHSPRASAAAVCPDGTYLITGGLGGLGLKLAAWLVQQGARHLVLVGRRAATAASLATIRTLEAAGASVLVAQADVSQQPDLVSVLAQIRATLPPLCGVFHAAGVLDDGLLLEQDWSRFERVMAAKVQGAWHLHVLTEKLPLSHFVLFSSLASLLGSPAQGNYAAANAYLDALAHYRQAQQLPGLSINWGAWAEVGMAASLASREQQRLAALGLELIPLTQGLQLLGQLLAESAPQVGVLPVHWPVFLRQFSAGRERPLLADLAGQIQHSKAEQLPVQQSASGNRIAEILLNSELAERQQLLESYLQREVALVVGLAVAKLDVKQSLNNLGLDSLMLLELKNRIEADLGVSIPMANFLQSSVVQLATQLLEQVKLPDPLPVEELLAQVDQFSEDEVDSLLHKLLSEVSH